MLLLPKQISFELLDFLSCLIFILTMSTWPVMSLPLGGQLSESHLLLALQAQAQFWLVRDWRSSALWKVAAMSSRSESYRSEDFGESDSVCAVSSEYTLAVEDLTNKSDFLRRVWEFMEVADQRSLVQTSREVRWELICSV